MNNLKIGVRLIGAFVLVSIIIVAVGLVAVVMSTNMLHSSDEIFHNRLPSIKSLHIISEAQTDLDAMENAVLSKHISGKERKDILARSEAAKKRIDEALKIYGPLPRTKEEDQVWNEFLSAWQNWIKDHENFISIADTYEKRPSDALYEKMSDQALESDTLLYVLSKNLLGKVIEINDDVATKEDNALHHMAPNFFRVIWGVIVLGTFLAIILGLIITRSITAPVKKLKNALLEIGKGKLDIKIAVSSKDEIGDLTNSFNAMAGDLYASMQKEKELAGAAATAEIEKKKSWELHALNQQLRASEQQLKAANQQLKAKEQALISKVTEVERFNKMMVGRELDMIELKKKINALCEALGKPKEFEEV